MPSIRTCAFDLAEDHQGLLPGEFPRASSARDRKERSIRVTVIGLGVVAVGLALVALGAGHHAGRTSSAALAGDRHFLSDKTVMAPEGFSPEAQQVMQAADAAKAAWQKDHGQAEALQQQIDEKAATGQKEVQDAAMELKEGQDLESKAKDTFNRDGPNSDWAKGMQADGEKKVTQAQDLAKMGQTTLDEAEGMKEKAQPTITLVGNEAATATDAVQKEKVVLEAEAKKFKEMADAGKPHTDAALSDATKKLDAANAKDAEAADRLKAAQDKLKAAEDRLAKDKGTITEAVVTEANSKQTVISSTVAEEQAKRDKATAEGLVKAAKAKQDAVDQEAAHVLDLEKQAMAKSIAHRVCVDMLGARLREPVSASDFAPVSVAKNITSAEQCSAWCLEHEGCAQAIFSSGNAGCYLFTQATREVHEWNNAFTSTVCGDKSQEKTITEIGQLVNGAKPNVPDLVTCSWSGEDCAATKCCNEVACNWNFNDCKAYSCYQNNGASSCQPTTGWAQGQIIGGGREVRKVVAGTDLTDKQGTSLFCFMVVDWKIEEGAVANNIKDKKVGIFECDANLILDGWEVPKTPWMTWINAGAFNKIWQQVKDNGEYAKHDWTIKVDADTVFFPNMVRMHLDSLKVPKGSRAYIKNVNYGTQFQGAIEVFTRQAVQLYFDKGAVCADKILKNEANAKAGEQFYIQACMNALGVDFIEDFMLLRDHMCGNDCGVPDAKCGDGWVAAYHFFRDVDSWNGCHDEARAAQLKAGHKPTDGGFVHIAAIADAKVEQLPQDAGADAQAAVDLTKQAADLYAHVKPDAAAAKQAVDDADAKLADAKKRIEDSAQAIIDANKASKDAIVASKEAGKDVPKAAAAKAAAEKVVSAREDEKEPLDRAQAAAQAVFDRAKAASDVVTDQLKHATDAETKARLDVASLRLCMDLPGVRLKGGTPVNFTAIAMSVDLSIAEGCRDWCRDHNVCKMSVYTAGNKGCYMFSDTTGEAQEFTPGYNSTLCGPYTDESSLKDMVSKIYKTMPYVPPIRECAWAGDDCRASQCCANVPVPNWQFTEFKWYTCYKKDENYASCQLGSAPGGWDGTVLGHMGTREVPKADEGVLIQGQSLFCFCVVMWHNGPKAAFWDSEADLANNIRNTGRSIKACDDHAFFEGSALGYGDGSSINNIDSFIGAWEMVRQDGRYLHHDWTVKVDADAVFFPDRLRMHIQSLRTPQGSRVYLRNINFKFQFLGAIEVLTKEALMRYYDKFQVCKDKVGHQGGEDYYMLSCLDGIGIDHQTDFALLNDKYAATGNCNDPWVVAFHFYKKVQHWNECHDAAVNSAKVNGKDWWQKE